MFSHPFALLLCASPKQTAKAARALSAVTNVIQVDCSRNHTASLEWLDSLPTSQRPLLLISGAHSPRKLAPIAENLSAHSIEYATVGVCETHRLNLDSAFSPQDYDLLAVIHTPRARPRLRSPLLVMHALRTASRLIPPQGIQIEIPLLSLSFVRPEGSAGNGGASLPEEATSLGRLYCEIFNRDLPDTCNVCAATITAGRPCSTCGAAPEAPAQILQSTDLGCVAVSVNRPDDCTAHFACL